jgi:hypothetical protein
LYFHNLSSGHFLRTFLCPEYLSWGQIVKIQTVPFYSKCVLGFNTLKLNISVIFYQNKVLKILPCVVFHEELDFWCFTFWFYDGVKLFKKNNFLLFTSFNLLFHTHQAHQILPSTSPSSPTIDKPIQSDHRQPKGESIYPAKESGITPAFSP